MPTVKIPGLNPATTIDADDLIHIRKDDGDYRISRDAFKATLEMTGDEVGITPPASLSGISNLQSLTNKVGEIETNYLSKTILAVCKTVADMTSASGPLLANGQRLTSGMVTSAANTGAIIKTTMHNTTSRVGGAEYQIKSRAQHRTDIGDAGWVPDGYGDHYLFNGSTFVAVLIIRRDIDPTQFGSIPSGASSANLQACLNRNLGIDGNGHQFVASGLTYSGDLTLKNITFLQTTTGTCLRNNVTPVSSGSTTLVFTNGQTTATFAASVGQIVLFKGAGVRFANVDGDYTYGQMVKVIKSSGGEITFEPGIAEGFTAATYSIYNPQKVTMSNVEFNAVGNINNSSMFVGDVIMDSNFDNLRIVGSGSQNIGAIVTGVNITLNGLIIRGVANNNVPLGYGFACNGSSITINNIHGSMCRHVVDSNSDRSYLCVGFSINSGTITKTADASIFAYVVGGHCNVLNPTYENLHVFGNGFLLAVRGGNGTVNKCYFHPTTNGNYGPILINEMPVDGINVTNNFFLGGESYCVYMSCESYVKNLLFTGNYTRGRKTMFRWPGVDMANIIISKNTGQAITLGTRNFGNKSVNRFHFSGNILESFGAASIDYFLDFLNCTDLTNVKICDNEIDDSLTAGFFRVSNIVDALKINIRGNTTVNATKSIEIAEPTIGDVVEFNVEGNTFAGKVNMLFAASETYSNTVRFTNNNVLVDAADAFVSQTDTPLLFAGNSFNTADDVTISGSQMPKGGNINHGAGDLLYSASPIAW
jgi:hypothetical protein